jgi:hypothetical protein
VPPLVFVGSVASFCWIFIFVWSLHVGAFSAMAFLGRNGNGVRGGIELEVPGGAPGVLLGEVPGAMGVEEHLGVDVKLCDVQEVDEPIGEFDEEAVWGAVYRDDVR